MKESYGEELASRFGLVSGIGEFERRGRKGRRGRQNGRSRRLGRIDRMGGMGTAEEGRPEGLLCCVVFCFGLSCPFSSAAFAPCALGIFFLFLCNTSVTCTGQRGRFAYEACR